MCFNTRRSVTNNLLSLLFSLRRCCAAYIAQPCMRVRSLRQDVLGLITSIEGGGSGAADRRPFRLPVLYGCVYRNSFAALVLGRFLRVMNFLNRHSLTGIGSRKRQQESEGSYRKNWNWLVTSSPVLMGKAGKKENAANMPFDKCPCH